MPNAVLTIRSVTQRVYRGYCSVNALVPAEAQRLRDARPALLAELRSIPGLEPKTLQDMEKYLGGFFDDIADDQALKKNLLSKCR